MLTRLLELDEAYFYGLPHLLQAVHYGSFAAALGGDPAQAQYHFMRAYALSQGRLLLVPLLEAQYYAVQVQDRAVFTAALAAHPGRLLRRCSRNKGIAQCRCQAPCRPIAAAH